jgi:carbonic anhydrase
VKRVAGDPLLEFYRANVAYSRDFAKGDLPLRAKTDVLIITCVDSRVDPAHFLSLREGEAYVYRSSGGRVSNDTVRTLLIAQLLGCRRIMLIRHTECGLDRWSNAELRARVGKELGLDASAVDFLPGRDLDQGVRDAVAWLRRSQFVRSDVDVTGHVYDLKSGRLREVRCPDRKSTGSADRSMRANRYVAKRGRGKERTATTALVPAVGDAGGSRLGGSGH